MYDTVCNTLEWNLPQVGECDWNHGHSSAPPHIGRRDDIGSFPGSLRCFAPLPFTISLAASAPPQAAPSLTYNELRYLMTHRVRDQNSVQLDHVTGHTFVCHPPHVLGSRSRSLHSRRIRKTAILLFVLEQPRKAGISGKKHHKHRS